MSPEKLIIIALGCFSAAGASFGDEESHIIPYQGRVAVAGTNFEGTGRFKFALITEDESIGQVTATATASISGGAVTAITMTHTGAGYNDAPVITITGGGGSGATATATEDDGEITIEVTNGGTGYTSLPLVGIPAPVAEPITTYWSNDGTSVGGSAPTGSVELPVTKGLFAVELGHEHFMNEIPGTALHAAARDGGAFLRVWFSDDVHGSQVLTPDQYIAPAVYLSDSIRLNGITTLGGPLQTEGGNARGLGASDFQQDRDLAAQVASGNSSFLGGGKSNTASGDMAFIGAGFENTASGQRSVIPGGSNNIASGNVSFAAGGYASAIHDFSFVWNGGGTEPFATTNSSQFLIRAPGGMGLNTNTLAANAVLTVNGNAKIIGSLVTDGLTSGSLVTGGITATAIGGTEGSFSSNLLVTGNVAANQGFFGGNVIVSGNVVANQFTTTSDRNAKESFAPVDAREILERVVAMPVQNWNFKQDSATRHIGPMAQDFYAAFGVGGDDKHIATVDADGVALAAIQGLNQLVGEKEAELTALRSDMQKMQTQIDALRLLLETDRAKTKSP